MALMNPTKRTVLWAMFGSLLAGVLAGWPGLIAGSLGFAILEQVKQPRRP